MNSEPLRKLIATLDRWEIETTLAGLDHGQTFHEAADPLGAKRRSELRAAFEAAGFDVGATDVVRAALAGAGAVHSLERPVTPIWTTPSSSVGHGQLTSEFHDAVLSARQSVLCSTYNFAGSSAMLNALQEVSARPGLEVTVLVDGTVGTATEIAAKLPAAKVFASTGEGGKPIRSHAKFVIIDSEIVLVTSANFSYSAEHLNIELGLKIHDRALAALLTQEANHLRHEYYEVA